MQQLFSAFGIDWRLLIAQAVNFGVVLVALWYFLYQPVLRTLEKRRQVIAQGVADAARAGEILAGADHEAAIRVKSADLNAESIVSAAREAAGIEKTRLLKEAESRAATLMKDAEMRAAETAARARRESERDVARLAILAAEKVMRQKHD
ncbi:MAG: ATP synthase F0 subunit B [Minisyncoccota bacterium]